jgi:hypothetical protein
MLHPSVVKFLEENVTPVLKNRGVIEGLPPDLSEVLKIANGFYAFSSAFLFRPASKNGEPFGICEWNDAALWKSTYPVDLADVLFFAEDVFGYQFGIRSGRVVQLEPETGTLDEIGESIDDFLKKVISNPGEFTGDVLLTEWMKTNRALFAGERLVAKCPFVCGGEFVPSNFIVKDEVSAMRARGNLASTLQGVEDGSEVIFKIE